MTQKPRWTRSARELAAGKLPVGAGGKAFVAVEPPGTRLLGEGLV